MRTDFNPIRRLLRAAFAMSFGGALAVTAASAQVEPPASEPGGPEAPPISEAPANPTIPDTPDDAPAVPSEPGLPDMPDPIDAQAGPEAELPRDLREEATEAKAERPDEFPDRSDQTRETETAPDARVDKGDDDRDKFREARRDDRGEDIRRPSARTTTSATTRSATSARFDTEHLRSADIGLWFGHAATDGLVVSDVVAGGAMHRFGFHEGDMVLSVNGAKVATEADFVHALFDPRFHDRTVEVIVFRDGRRMPIHVEPRLLIEEHSRVDVDPLDQLGIVLDDRHPDRARVWKVLPRLPAFYAGIRAGDVIVNFGGHPVKNAEELKILVANPGQGPIDIQVARQDRTRRLSMEAPVERPRKEELRTAERPMIDPQVRGAAAEVEIDREIDRDVDRRLEGRENRIERRDDRRDIRVAPSRPWLFPRLRGRW